MPRADHLAYAGVTLTLAAIGIAIFYPQQIAIGLGAFALAIVVVAFWARGFFAGPAESLRPEWLGLEAKFQVVHDAAPRPTPGVPWHGGNPHPYGSWDGRHWQLRGDNEELRKQMEVLCLDAGTLLLKSRRLKRSLNASIREERDPIVRWLKFVHLTHGFNRTFEIGVATGINETETLEGGNIEFLPNASVLAARRCAALC
jgi:hypothetical protein